MKNDLIYKIMNPYKNIVERIIPGAISLEVYLWHIGRYVFALEFIKPDDLVLDIACGVGYGSYLLAKKGAKKVIGIDISKDAINYAKARYLDRTYNIEFLVGDATNMPINSSEIDVLVSFEAIEHIKNPDIFLMGCERALKDHGTLILSTPNKYVSLKKHIENPYHVKEFFLEEIIDKTTSLGLEIVEIYGQRPINNLPDSVNISKKVSKNFLTIISKLIPRFIKKKIFAYWYLPRKTGIPIKMINKYENNTHEFEEWIIHNGVDRRYLPLPISDIESDRYKFDVFVIVAKKV